MTPSLSELRLPLLLETVTDPTVLKEFSIPQLVELADEIRMVLCALSEQRSVHFASNLGVVELAVALHSTFDFCHDRLIWDTGHQCYPHKILTGRFKNFESIRTLDGLMGYPNPEESDFDLFMTGHAGCSVGSALGLSLGDGLLRPEEHRHSFAVVGDGAIASGVIFEALNLAGGLNENLTVILNDNKMSICNRVGGLGHYLDRLRLNPTYRGVKNGIRRMVDSIPTIGTRTGQMILRLKDGVKAGLTGGMLFEEFGFCYIGPIDGHDIPLLKRYLKLVREFREPVLLHILTEKGRGYRDAELDPTLYHAPSPEIVGHHFELVRKNNNHSKKTGENQGGDDGKTETNPVGVTDPKEGAKDDAVGNFKAGANSVADVKPVAGAKPVADAKPVAGANHDKTSETRLSLLSSLLPNDDNWDMPGEHSFTHWARNAIYRLMKEDERVCVLTAAMTQGTMLEPVREAFPSRFFDVGICEANGVVTAAGLAKAGMRPIVDIYSTFLQRAYDHLFQEVSLQNLPVIFMIDRAGVVGADGPTHHGVFDLAYLRPFPNFRLLAPGDSHDLEPMLRFAAGQPFPTAIRYPKTTAARIARPPVPIEEGKAEILRPGRDGTVAVLGGTLQTALDAADYFASLPEGERVDLEIINARFAKPLDAETILRPLRGGRFLITVEEGVLAGGFGSAVLEAASDARLDIRRLKRLGIPDRYIHHGSRSELLAEIGLDRAGLIRAVEELR